MGKGKCAYVVCAKVYGADIPGPDVSEVMAGQPVVRRLNRMERVALAFDGTLIRRAHHALLIAFDTADAAFFGACEMQRRCADLPQAANDRLQLQIGIHEATAGTRSHAAWLGSRERYEPHEPREKSEQRERRDHGRRIGFDTADHLASIAQDDGIIVSAPVLEALTLTVRQAGEAVVDTGNNLGSNQHADLRAQAFYWRKVLQFRSAARPAKRVANPVGLTTPRLFLRHGWRELEIDSRDGVTTFGRSPGCDVTVADHFVSRVHARIEIRGNSCVLTDQSSNGTSVVFDGGEEVRLRNQSDVLKGKGWLGFGQSAREVLGDTTQFEVVELDQYVAPEPARASAPPARRLGLNAAP
ncbi:MAG: FHA domain-containing protein [Propionivibrio sp.]